MNISMILALMVIVLGCMMMPFKLFKNSQWYFFAIAFAAVAFFMKEFIQGILNIGNILSWFYSILSIGLVMLVLYGTLSLQHYLTKYLTKK